MDRLLNGNGSFAEPVRIAVVGLGYWGPNLARNLQELPEPSSSAVCDSDGALAHEAVSPLSRGLRHEADFDTLLEDDSLEAVAIATPVVDALRAGAAGARGRQARVRREAARGLGGRGAHLIDAARERGLTLVPGHTFLYSPSVNLIREQIRLGATRRRRISSR